MNTHTFACSKRWCRWCRYQYYVYKPGWLVGSLVFNGTFSTNRLYCAIEVWNILWRAAGG